MMLCSSIRYIWDIILFLSNKDPVTPNYWVSANLADLGDTFAGDWERFSRVCRVIPSF
jgi:hypothetical protein